MRSPLRAAAAALALTAASAAVRPAFAQAALKLAYVDVATVLDQTPGRADAQQTLEREGQAFQAEHNRMLDSLNTLAAAYQKAQPALTPAQRQTREREFQAKQQEYNQRDQANQERFQRRQQELAGGFETMVRQAIEEVRSTGGYTMIFASGPNSPMLAADKSLDVTDQVLARIRTMAATRGTTPRPTGAAPTTPTGGAPAAAPAGAARPRGTP